jgi:hypothetical protein
MVQKNTMTRLLIIGVLICLGCRKTLPVFEDVDIEAWKKDKNGCADIRSHSIQSLIRQKEKLKTLSEMEIVSLLGKPDQNELYKRNQKFYYYFLSPSTKCGGSDTVPTLIIRFNAVGLAKEIIIE